MFTPAKGEFIVQNGSECRFYEVEMGKEGPVAKEVFEVKLPEKDMPAGERIHQGVVHKNERHILLFDKVNFYKITIQNKQVITFKGNALFVW